MSYDRPRFQCSHPHCDASYARKEHLIRHEAKHKEAAAYVCPECDSTFSRSDTFRRHRKIHSKDDEETTPKVSRACDRCNFLKERCDKNQPCAACVRKGLPCTFDRTYKKGRRSGSVLSGIEYEESKDGSKRRRVGLDQPGQFLCLNDLINSVNVSPYAHTPPPPPTQQPSQAESQSKSVVAMPSTSHNPQLQCVDEEESMQRLRVTLRQYEAQLQHEVMNTNDAQQLGQEPSHQNQPPENPALRRPIFTLLNAYNTSKLYLADDAHFVSSELESVEMLEFMCNIDVGYYVDLYFAHFHGQWPFLCRQQFNPETEPQPLVLAMTMCALRLTEERVLVRLARLLHVHIHAILVTQMDNWTVKEYSSHRWPMATYQTILLCTIFAITANDDEDEDKDKEKEKRWHDELDVLDCVYPIFTRLVSTCRIQQMLYYPSMLAQIHDDDALSYKFTASEEFKYFALTLFKVDSILSRLMQLDHPVREPTETSNNNSNTTQDKINAYGGPLSISELQFPLPASNYLWEANGIREWLRRRARQCRSPTQFPDMYNAMLSNDREKALDRTVHPWICDILRPVMTEHSTGDQAQTVSSQISLTIGKGAEKLRRKAWMRLGPWLGYLVGVDVMSVS